MRTRTVVIFWTLVVVLIVTGTWYLVPAVVDLGFDFTPHHAAVALLWAVGDFMIFFVLWCMSNARAAPERERAERAEQQEYERMRARHAK